MIMNLEQTLKLPDQIKLLFENEYLDTFSVLVILSSFPNKGFITIRNVIFYYTLIFNENEQYNNSSDIFFSYEKKMKDLIIRLHSLDLIEVVNKKDISCKVNEKGLQFVLTLESSYFIELREKSIKKIKETPFSATLEKQIFGGGRNGTSNKNK